MNMHKHITKFYNFSRKFSQVGATGGTEISLGGAPPVPPQGGRPPVKFLWAAVRENCDFLQLRFE